jgi:hypothetical protein
VNANPDIAVDRVKHGLAVSGKTKAILIFNQGILKGEVSLYY